MSRLLTAEEIEKFQKLLRKYSPNHSVLSEFQASKFAVIAGPAGAGKDTLRNALLKQDSKTYVRILSTTTRPPRSGEQEGLDYYFRSPGEVETGLIAREFFQAQLVHNQQVSCMHADEVRKLGSGQIGLSILIVQTEVEFSKIKPDIKTIFLIPPSLEILLARMQAERVLNPDEVNRRLAAAKRELEIALARPDYYCIVSSDLGKLTKKADEFMKTGGRDDTADNEARGVIRETLNDLRELRLE